MQFHYKIHSAFAILFLGLLTFSCKKSSSPSSAPSGPLQISAVSPLEGGAGTIVTIIGSGFSATPGLNSVSFNGKAAAVTYADDSILLVTVPLTAGAGNVSVKVNGKSATGPSFTYDYQGIVTTFAGSSSALPGAVNGTGATFNSPQGITVDGSGNLYVADFNNKMIRKVTTDGTVSTLVNLGDYPRGVALDGKGNLYVSLSIRPRILQVSLSTSDTVTLSGSGVPSFKNSTNGLIAEFNGPEGLAVDHSGNVYVADSYNNCIRVITPTGATSTFAGAYPASGAQNGEGSTATFYNPSGLVFDATGNLYVADFENCLIRKITSDTTVSTLAGNGFPGFIDQTALASGFTYPAGVAMDSKSNVYVTDGGNNAIRMITPAGAVTTIAGGSGGSADGIGPAASFETPAGITCDNNGTLWVTDSHNNTIRKIILQ